MKIRLIAATLGVALVAAACADSSSGEASGTTTIASSEVTTATTTDASSETTAGTTTVPTGTNGLPVGVSALDDRFSDTFPEPLIDPHDIIAGGPPPDGIPPIEDPQFISVAEADTWLNDPEPVMVVDIDGDVRAYPIQILMWHEIVNDTVGGTPLSVTYCPLCNSAITFKREVRGVETTFGTSGRLYFANLVMYDRATETMWNQFDGRAVVGLLTGDVLEQVPSTMVAWGDFKTDRPDAIVLDRDQTGYSRPYGTNPYTGLDDPNGQPFLFSGTVDPRALAMTRVVALESDGEAIAWALDAISGGEAAVTTGEIGGESLVIFWKTGQSSALETGTVDTGRDVGTVGVFSPIVDGDTLTFTAVGDDYVDDVTGTTWNVLGDAIEGPLAGRSLEPITFVRTFWFSWAAFRPGTQLIEG